VNKPPRIARYAFIKRGLDAEIWPIPDRLPLTRIIHESSTATASTQLRQAWLPFKCGQARRSVGRHPVQGCLPPSRLHVPVSQGVFRFRYEPSCGL